MALITKDEYQTLTNTILTGYPADYVDAVLNTLSDHLENWCSRRFAEATITDEMAQSYVTRKGWLKVHTKYTPVISVSGLKYQFAGSTNDIDLSNADIDYELGMIRLLWYRPLLGGPDKWITLLSYKAGYATIPTRAKMAVALLAREAIEADDQAAKEGVAYPLESYRIGSYSETYAIARINGGSDLGLGTELSLRAKALALPYRRAGIV
jgi:hypothetical protein